MPYIFEEIALADTYFLELARASEDYTIVDIRRRYMLYQLLLHCVNIDGDMAEVGVYQGGTALMIVSLANRAKKFTHLFDTFAGLPMPNGEHDNYHKQGTFSDCSEHAIISLLKGKNDFRTYKGLFPQTAVPVTSRRFSFVHVDVDLYQSTKDVLEVFYPRMNPSGVMLCDDYGFISCSGAKIAMDEFFADKKEHVICVPTMQAFVVKGA